MGKNIIKEPIGPHYGKKALIIPRAGSGTYSSKGPAAPHQSRALGAVADSSLVSKAVLFKEQKLSVHSLKKLSNPPAWLLGTLPVSDQGTKSELGQEDPQGNQALSLP